MTDLSPQGRAHLRKNAQTFGDEAMVDVLDALQAALNERDELRDLLVDRLFAAAQADEPATEPEI
ncbi:hypothetical protein [Rhodococcus sp. NPDC060176]|uniref:hypothetical protein n=1 Tax=Rhodococcus sp. NPDC060176 TaxID=3347062 RepID=UPI0036547D14